MIINGIATASVQVVNGLAIVSAKTWEGPIDLLNENGTYLLLETSDKLLKESGHGGH